MLVPVKAGIKYKCPCATGHLVFFRSFATKGLIAKFFLRIYWFDFSCRTCYCTKIEAQARLSRITGWR